MAYREFMFDEAFQFHEDKPVKPICTNEEELEIKDERLPPLGACSNDENTSSKEALDDQQFVKLQEQHEQLNSSLFALTSHFAQILRNVPLY